MKYLYLILSLLIAGCTGYKPNLGLAEQFLPEANLLKEGVYNKYYVYHTSGDNYGITRLNIHYRGMRSTQPGILEIQSYNAGFEPTYYSTYEERKDGFYLNNQYRIVKGDTIHLDIHDSLALDWSGTAIDSLSHTEAHENSWTFQTKRKQTMVKDSVVLGKSAKIFELLNEREGQYGERNFKQDASIRTTYVEGLGLFEQVRRSKKASTKLELVEQLTKAEFEKRANHGLKRIGFIDTSSVLDKDASFTICDKMEQIVDYYNGTPDAGYPLGKFGLKNDLIPRLNPIHFKGYEGYLTFRFVINCQGEIGWITAKATDFDYHETTFPEKDALAISKEIKNLKNWTATVLRSEHRDAYAYLTFIIKNGKIVDLLP